MTDISTSKASFTPKYRMIGMQQQMQAADSGAAFIAEWEQKAATKLSDDNKTEFLKKYEDLSAEDKVKVLNDLKAKAEAAKAGEYNKDIYMLQVLANHEEGRDPAKNSGVPAFPDAQLGFKRASGGLTNQLLEEANFKNLTDLAKEDRTITPPPAAGANPPAPQTTTLTTEEASKRYFEATKAMLQELKAEGTREISVEVKGADGKSTIKKVSVDVAIKGIDDDIAAKKDFSKTYQAAFLSDDRQKDKSANAYKTYLEQGGPADYIQAQISAEADSRAQADNTKKAHLDELKQNIIDARAAMIKSMAEKAKDENATKLDLDQTQKDIEEARKKNQTIWDKLKEQGGFIGMVAEMLEKIFTKHDNNNSKRDQGQEQGAGSGADKPAVQPSMVNDALTYGQSRSDSIHAAPATKGIIVGAFGLVFGGLGSAVGSALHSKPEMDNVDKTLLNNLDGFLKSANVDKNAINDTELVNAVNVLTKEVMSKNHIYKKNGELDKDFEKKIENVARLISNHLVDANGNSIQVLDSKGAPVTDTKVLVNQIVHGTYSPPVINNNPYNLKPEDSKAATEGRSTNEQALRTDFYALAESGDARQDQRIQQVMNDKNSSMTKLLTKIDQAGDILTPNLQDYVEGKLSLDQLKNKGKGGSKDYENAKMLDAAVEEAYKIINPTVTNASAIAEGVKAEEKKLSQHFQR